MATCGEFGGRTMAGAWCKNAAAVLPDGSLGPCYLRANPAHVPATTPTPVPPPEIVVPASPAEQNTAMEAVMLKQAIGGDGRLALLILQARGFFPPLRFSDADAS